MSRMSVQQALFAGIGGASIAFMPHTALAMTFGGMSGNLLSSPFAPFIAGTGHMNFGKFTFFNVIGGVSWVSLFVLVGYFFGGVPFVQDHFEVIVLGIVGVSVLPAFIGAVKTALNARARKQAGSVDEEVLAEARVQAAERRGKCK